MKGKKTFLSTCTACILLSAMFILVSCQKGVDTNSGIEDGLPDGTSAVKKPIELTLTGKINPDMPELMFKIKGYEDNMVYPYHATNIMVYNNKTNDFIQEITVNTNGVDKNTLGLNLVDVNFDGYNDILLLKDIQGSHANYIYNSYIWNHSIGEFVKNESFSNIINPAIDSKNKKILSVSTNWAASHTFRMYSFLEGEFVLTNEFTEEAVDVSDAGKPQQWHIVEKKLIDGKLKKVNDQIFSDKNNAEVSQYYKDGSFWDVENLKWYNSDYGKNLGIDSAKR